MMRVDGPARPLLECTVPRKFLRRLLPDSRSIREHRLFEWLGPALHHPRVWHISREGIALGAAIGIFFGLLVPVAQSPLAAMTAIVLRANLPMAVIGTLVTNPFTFAPLYYLAYRLGAWLMGADPSALINEGSFVSGAQGLSGWLDVWSARLLQFGRPLFVGLLLMACVSAVFVYFAIHGLWRLFAVRAWRRRAHARKSTC